MKNFDIIYISSNISFLLDCYINSYKDLNLCLIDREDSLGGAWQISNARVHLQWVSNEHKKYISVINEDLKKINPKFFIKGPLVNVKMITEEKYSTFSLYHINLGSNLFMKELIEKIKKRPNVKIKKDNIKEVVLKNNVFNVIGNEIYKSNKLYLTNNLKLDKITLNSKNYKLKHVDKKYRHLFIKIKSKSIKPLDVLICQANDFKWDDKIIFSQHKQKIHKNLDKSLNFLVNVTDLYDIEEDTQFFSCRIKDKNFVDNFKKYLIYNKITESDVEIKILEDDEYTQSRLINISSIPQTKNLEVFTKMNYFKYLVRLNELRNGN